MSWARQILPFTSAATLDRGVLDRPYLLPCLVVAAIGLTILILDIFFMEETQPDIRRRHAKRDRAKAIRATGSQTSESAALLSPGAALQLKTNIGHNIHEYPRLVNVSQPVASAINRQDPKSLHQRVSIETAGVQQGAETPGRSRLRSGELELSPSLGSEGQLRSLLRDMSQELDATPRTPRSSGPAAKDAGDAKNTSDGGARGWDGQERPQHKNGMGRGAGTPALDGENERTPLAVTPRAGGLRAPRRLQSLDRPLLERHVSFDECAPIATALDAVATPGLAKHPSCDIHSMFCLFCTACCHLICQPDMFWSNCGTFFSWRGQVVLKSHSLF